MKLFTNLWNNFLAWLEHGDLVPWIVVVSAVHYSVILQEHDHWITATAIGLMVDLGHFRTVRAAVRYKPTKTRSKRAKGNAKQESWKRWGMATFMTTVSIVYQQRFYNDLWLSLPLPFLIAALAWLQQKDQRLGTKKQTEENEPSQPKQKAEAEKRIESESLPFICPVCERHFKTQNGLNPHLAKCKANQSPVMISDTLKTRQNGHSKEKVN